MSDENFNMEEFMAVLEKLKGVELNPWGRPKRLDWSDKYFYDSIFQPNMMKLRPSAAVSYAASKTFCKFYLGASLTDVKYENLIMTVLCNMNIDGEPIILDSSFDKDSPINIEEELGTVMDQSTSDSTDLASKSSGKSTEKEARDFANYFDQLEESEAINLSGFLALLTLRCVTKDSTSVANHIGWTGAKKFTEIFQSKITVKLPPPSLDSLEMLKRFVDKSVCHRFSSKFLLSHLVHSVTCRDESSKAAKCILSTCLSNVIYNGMGLFSWAIQASNALSVTLPELLPYVGFNIFETSLKHLNEVLDLQEKGEEKTWPYARLFEDGAFMKCNTKENCRLIAVFIAICKPSDYNRIIKAMPAMKNAILDTDLVNLVGIANAIREKLTQCEKKEGTSRSEV